MYLFYRERCDSAFYARTSGWCSSGETVAQLFVIGPFRVAQDDQGRICPTNSALVDELEREGWTIARTPVPRMRGAAMGPHQPVPDVASRGRMRVLVMRPSLWENDCLASVQMIFPIP